MPLSAQLCEYHQFLVHSACIRTCLAEKHIRRMETLKATNVMMPWLGAQELLILKQMSRNAVMQRHVRSFFLRLWPALSPHRSCPLPVTAPSPAREENGLQLVDLLPGENASVPARGRIGPTLVPATSEERPEVWHHFQGTATARASAVLKDPRLRHLLRQLLLHLSQRQQEH